MLKKWTKTTLFAATAALVLTVGTFTSCSDDDEVYEEIPEFDIKDGILQYYNGTGGDVTIPDDVRIIGSNAFASSAITSVVIPSGVVEIQSQAFWLCTSLKNVTLPAVKEMADNAFSGCSSLEKLTYNGTLKDWCSQPGLMYLAGGSIESIKLSDVTDLKTAKTLEIPIGVTGINDYALYNCWLLESVTISESVKYIGDCAFSGCSLLKSVTIPASVTSIGPRAFKDCQSLESVEFTVTDNWYTTFNFASYTNADVSKPSDNATKLRDTTYSNWGYTGLYKKN